LFFSNEPSWVQAVVTNPHGGLSSVRAIVEWWKFGASPEEILENLPHLTLSQIFDALSYYVDHRDVIEQYIAENIVEREKP
jgi:hypothetical protein